MKLNLIQKLLSPLSYLRIYHGEKMWVDFGFPLILATSLTALIIWLPGDIRIVGERGLISQVNGLLQILTGFYIVALAAISTFDGKGMDQVMDGQPPVIMEKREGVKRRVFLTRRRFLCYLFGYLSLTCFALFSIGLIANLLYPAVNLESLAGSWWTGIRFSFLFVYLLALSNVTTTTLLGLYYLTVRIHVHKPQRMDSDHEE